MSVVPPLPPLLSSLPVGPQRERLPGLDAVRGFALLGILLMNIEGFNGPLWLAGAGVEPTQTGWDRWLDTFIYVVVQGSFFPLFSLLFGIGFALMGQRLRARGQPFVAIHLRRMGCLALIGLLHGVLVWSGDILLSYALLGLLLPAFDGLPRRWLGWAGGVGIVCAALVVVMLGAMMSLVAADPGSGLLQQVQADIQAQVRAQEQAYAYGSYAQAVQQRAGDVLAGLQNLIVLGGQLLGLFLIGAGLVGSGALANPAGHARLWAGLRWGAWPLGLALSLWAWKVSPYNPPWDMGFDQILAQALKLLAGSLIGLGWLAWGLRWQHLLRPLAPMGRMALSNYLAQSLICTALFYGYGLGLFGQFSRSGEVALALAVFVVQLLVSHLWLRHFAQGPAEWLWRAVTYGRLPPLRAAG